MSPPPIGICLPRTVRDGVRFRFACGCVGLRGPAGFGARATQREKMSLQNFWSDSAAAIRDGQSSPASAFSTVLISWDSEPPGVLSGDRAFPVPTPAWLLLLVMPCRQSARINLRSAKRHRRRWGRSPTSHFPTSGPGFSWSTTRRRRAAFSYLCRNPCPELACDKRLGGRCFFRCFLFMGPVSPCIGVCGVGAAHTRVSHLTLDGPLLPDLGEGVVERGARDADETGEGLIELDDEE
jgi:hypothetical protein